MSIENDFQRVYGTIKETEDRLKALILSNANSYLWRMPTSAAAHPLNNVRVDPTRAAAVHAAEIEQLKAQNELLRVENERLRAALTKVRSISTEATPEEANR